MWKIEKNVKIENRYFTRREESSECLLEGRSICDVNNDNDEGDDDDASLINLVFARLTNCIAFSFPVIYRTQTIFKKLKLNFFL